MSRPLHLSATYLKKTVTVFELKKNFIAVLVKYNFYCQVLIDLDGFIWQTKDRKFLSEMAPDKHYLEHILNRLSEQKNTQTKCHKKVKTQVSRLSPALRPRLNWLRL